MDRSFYYLFRKQALNQPKKVALIFEDRNYTYGELLEKTDVLAKKLKSITKGEKAHLATFLENSLEMVLLLLAASKVGITLVPLPPDLPENFAYEIMKTCDVEIALVQNRRAFNGITTLSVDNLWNISHSKISEEEYVNLDSPFIITTTSGSTGKPKPIVLTQRIKLKRAFKGAKEIFNLSEDDIYIVSTPLYHSLAQRFTLLPLITGATVVLMKRFYLQNWLNLVENCKVSFAVLVSSQLENIVFYIWKNKEKYRLGNLKKLISSSAPLLEKTRKKILELAKNYGWTVYETYGTSEIGFASILNIMVESQKWDSVGKPLPYVDIKILSPEGKELPPYQIGEIAVKTETVFAGYYKMPKKTQESFTQDGYFLTGDLGYIDEDGYLYFRGRKKEVIITGGINVYPQDVEKVILSHPKVKECAVFGMENDYFGEVVCALIVPEDKTLSEKELRNYLRGKLTSYQMPVYIQFVEEIPKNQLGKIARKNLKSFVNTTRLEQIVGKLENLLL